MRGGKGEKSELLQKTAGEKKEVKSYRDLKLELWQFPDIHTSIPTC